MTPVYFGPRSSPLQNTTVGRFVCKTICGDPTAIRDFCSMAVMENGNLVAGCLFHNWRQESGVIEITGAGLNKRWMTRRVINAMFDLPFSRFGCQMITAHISEKRQSALQVARAFGCDEFFIPRLGGRDEGEFVFTLTDDQWSGSKFRRPS